MFFFYYLYDLYRYVGRFVDWLRGAFTAPGQNITNKGGAIGAVMSPMYASCTTRLVKESADLVFVEFVQNDLYRAGGMLKPRNTIIIKCICGADAYNPGIVKTTICPHNQQL